MSFPQLHHLLFILIINLLATSEPQYILQNNLSNTKHSIKTVSFLFKLVRTQTCNIDRIAYQPCPTMMSDLFVPALSDARLACSPPSHFTNTACLQCRRASSQAACSSSTAYHRARMEGQEMTFSSIPHPRYCTGDDRFYFSNSPDHSTCS